MTSSRYGIILRAIYVLHRKNQKEAISIKK